MNYVEEILQATYIALLVANFLLNTSRALKAIELCKESLVLLNGKDLSIEKDFGQIMYVMYKLYERVIPAMRKTGNREGEALAYAGLGTVCISLCEYVKAKEYQEKELAIYMEIGDRVGEAVCSRNLGYLFCCLGELVKAKKYEEKALAIYMEIGDREGEASCYGNLGTLFCCIGELVKGEKYQEKALAIYMEIGDRVGEAECARNLGSLFCCVGEFVKANEYQEKALAMSMEIGDREGEASCYERLVEVFKGLGEYAKANEYLEKALSTRTRRKDISKKDEAKVWMTLGEILLSRNKYGDAVKYFEKALAMNVTIIGNRRGEAMCYGKLGAVFQTIRNMLKAKEYHEKALAIATEIGDRELEGKTNLDLGYVCVVLHECFVAEKHFKKALSISKDIGHAEMEFRCYYYLAFKNLSQENPEAAFSYLDKSVRKFEEMRALVGDSDQFKISLADHNVFPYKPLCTLLCDSGKPSKAIYAAELGRARALADLMTTQYSTETHISADQQSWIGIENVMKKESNCACLYMFYFLKRIFLWILKTSGAVSLRHIRVDKKTLHTR